MEENDIIIVNNKAVQYLGKEMDNGVVVQDIHTKIELVHIHFIERKATNDETKWFCENTENINFVKPNTKIR